MTDNLIDIRTLRAALGKANERLPDDPADYQIAVPVPPGFLGISRTGNLAFLIPLETVPPTTGRRGGGFSLSPAPRVAFQHGGRVWEQSAATLDCTDDGMVDSFLALIIDIAQRLSALDRSVTWEAIVRCVDEWQALLSRCSVMTTEQQLGLWTELWIICISADPDRLAMAWRGPEANATDFFLDGIGLEVKASRQRFLHHVSQRQVDTPVGTHDAYLMSVWIGIDPGNGRSLSELVDAALSKVSDAPALLKTIISVGYSPNHRAQYTTRFVVLETPAWFRIDAVPRVRSADRGVSQLRYVVALNPEDGVMGDAASALWRHFCGISATSTALARVLAG